MSKSQIRKPTAIHSLECHGRTLIESPNSVTGIQLLGVFETALGSESPVFTLAHMS